MKDLNLIIFIFFIFFNYFSRLLIISYPLFIIHNFTYLFKSIISKYTYFKYASTRNHYFKYLRKTIFEKNNIKHKESKEVTNDYVCPFCYNIFESPYHFGFTYYFTKERTIITKK